MARLAVLAIFVGIPLLVIGLIYLLVYAPSWARGPRYRPGQSWESDTEWFGDSVPVGSAPAELATSASEPSEARPTSSGSGGASADW